MHTVSRMTMFCRKRPLVCKIKWPKDNKKMTNKMKNYTETIKIS